MEKIYRVQMNSKGMPNFSTAVEVADRPQDDDWEKYSDKLWKNAYERGKADRPQGEWIKDNLGTVICSECKRPRRDNRINHINFCNSCGARMKGAADV